MNRRILASLAPTSLCLLALLPSGCLPGAPLDNEEEFQQVRGCDMDTLLKQCGGSGCHEGDSYYPIPYGVVDFFGPDAPGNLVGLPAVYPAAANQLGDCPTDNPELIINPTDPASSLILKKIKNEQTCGEGMPTNWEITRLEDDEIACFEQWVNDVIAESGGAN